MLHLFPVDAQCSAERTQESHTAFLVCTEVTRFQGDMGVEKVPKARALRAIISLMNCNDDSSGPTDHESMPGLAFTIPNDYLKQL